MCDKLTTLETKRARRAKQFSPRFDIRALEMELRKENQHAVRNDYGYRVDYGRVDYVERITQQ